MVLIEADRYWESGYDVRILQDEETSMYAVLLRVGSLDVRTPAKYVDIASLKEEVTEAIARFDEKAGIS